MLTGEQGIRLVEAGLTKEQIVLVYRIIDEVADAVTHVVTEILKPVTQSVTIPVTEKLSNAERQRRFRNKDRNADSNETVTDRVTKDSEKNTSSHIENASAPDSLLLSSKVSKKEKNTKKTGDYTDDFEAFWLAYPRKTGSKFKAFQRYIDFTDKHKIDPARILRATEAYSGLCVQEGTDERYIAHPLTWLNGKRWETLIPESTPAESNIGKPGYRNGNTSGISLLDDPGNRPAVGGG